MGVRVFLINLARDKERLRLMSGQLAALGLPYERVEGVYGTDLSDDLKPCFLGPDGQVASKLLPGEVGCYASHLRVLRVIAEGDEPALVLEDDIYIGEDFPELLRNIDLFPNGWDIVRLSNPLKRRRFTIGQITSNYEVVKYSKVPRSTGAYLITPEGARKFLTWKTVRDAPIDQDMRKDWAIGLTTYGIYPRPIIPDVLTSSIDRISPRPRHQKAEKTDLRDILARIRHDISWLGFSNWVISLIPRKYPDLWGEEAKRYGQQP